MNYQTDKFANKLISEYEKIFAELKDQPVKVLEVGILHGGFLLWLNDFFKKGEITGADIIMPKTKEEILNYSDRINIEYADQNDDAGLKNIGKIHGFFDIIIDDGCHRQKETENTFRALWPFIKSGGLYIIEDFIAGYWNINQYHGMPQVITEIMENKNDLKISDYNIILKEPKCSIAIFKKYGTSR